MAGREPGWSPGRSPRFYQQYDADAAARRSGNQCTPHRPRARTFPRRSDLDARWIFMLAGGLVFGGLWMVWLAGH